MEICPNCGSDNWLVIDTRPTENGRRRRKECGDCGERWTTYEIPQAELNTLKAQVDGLQKRMDMLVDFCATLKGRRI